MSLPKSLMRLAGATFLSIGLAACGGGGGNNDAGGGAGGGGPVVEDPTLPPVLTATVPAQNADQVDPLTAIEFVFNKNIDNNTVDENDIVLTASTGDVDVRFVGAADNRIRVLLDAPLPRGAAITVDLGDQFADTDGNAPESAFTLRFDTEDIVLQTSVPHENTNEKARLGTMKLGSNGDGMSVFRVGNGQLYYHRIVDGHPTGGATPFVTTTGNYVSPSSLSIATNGDAQVLYSTYTNNRWLLHVQRWDAVSETWASPLNFTPNALSQLREYTGDVDNLGGIVAWTEESINDSSKQAVAVAFPDASGFTADPTYLRLADAQRYSLNFDRSGTQSVLAWIEPDGNNGRRVAMVSHDRAAGFSSIQTRGTPGLFSSIRGVGASTSGYRYVLEAIRDANDDELLRLHVAGPGQVFGQPVLLYASARDLRGAKLVVNDAGVASVLFVTGGNEPGVWFRRYVPATGIEAPIDVTGKGRIAVSSSNRTIDLDMDETGNAIALASYNPEGNNEQEIAAAILPRVGTPRVGIVLDTARDRPTTPTVVIMRHPNTSVQLFWTHRVTGPLDYDIRTRRMGTNGVAGPLSYLSTDAEVVVSEPMGAFAPSGRGVFLWSELDVPQDNIRQLTFDQ